jgi:DNA-binding response OmpR family regulator
LNFKHHILLLEDETEASDMLATFLEMQGYEVIKALNGAKAMEHIQSNPAGIDMAILDIMVPEINGIEICRTIRNHPMMKEIPVIFLTPKIRNGTKFMDWKWALTIISQNRQA